MGDNRVLVSFSDRQRCFQGCICLHDSPTFVCRANLLTQSVSLRNDNFLQVSRMHLTVSRHAKLFLAIRADTDRTVCLFRRRKGRFVVRRCPPFRCIVRWRARSQDDVMHRKSVCLFCVQMKRLLQLLQQRWLLRSLVPALRTVPTSSAARPCFPREPPLPPPPPLPAPARAPWR